MADFEIKTYIASISTIFAEVLGKDAWMVALLIYLMLADLVLGVLSAYKRDRALSGKRLHEGMLKFLAYGATIVLVYLVQEIIHRVVPIQIPLLSLFPAYQALTEIKSISRHLKRLGLPIPKIFDDVVARSDDKVKRILDVADTKKQY